MLACATLNVVQDMWDPALIASRQERAKVSAYVFIRDGRLQSNLRST